MQLYRLPSPPLWSAVIEFTDRVTSIVQLICSCDWRHSAESRDSIPSRFGQSTVGPVHDSGSPVDAPAELGAFLNSSAHFAYLFGLDKAFQINHKNMISQKSLLCCNKNH